MQLQASDGSNLRVHLDHDVFSQPDVVRYGELRVCRRIKERCADPIRESFERQLPRTSSPHRKPSSVKVRSVRLDTDVESTLVIKEVTVVFGHASLPGGVWTFTSDADEKVIPVDRVRRGRTITR